MKTFIGKSGFAFLEERETRLKQRWFHYSPPETFAHTTFRSPDWLLWREGQHEAAVAAMYAKTTDGVRENDRTQIWARNGVRASRLQVVDALSLADPGSPLNYLLTYLAVTHPTKTASSSTPTPAPRRGSPCPTSTSSSTTTIW